MVSLNHISEGGQNGFTNNSSEKIMGYRILLDSEKIWTADNDKIAHGYYTAVTAYAGETKYAFAGNLAWRLHQGAEETVATAELIPGMLRIQRTLKALDNGWREVITIENIGKTSIVIEEIDTGYLISLSSKAEYALAAIPFTVQQDGRRHVYSGRTLANGEYRSFVNDDRTVYGDSIYGNSVYSDPSRPEPPLMEHGRLRSEAWAWGDDAKGILVIKYNPNEIEYSVAMPMDTGELKLGGVGLCLYGEPSGARRLEAGCIFRFGETLYTGYEGGIEAACNVYREFLDLRGHALPKDYEPPVHWNVLYDIGWYHSDRKALIQEYTRERLLEEAQKAAECGCDALYLDPGWEYAEGLTLWDAHRLGQMPAFVSEIKEKYGLEVGIRTILRTYINYWPSELGVRHGADEVPTACLLPETIIPSNQLLWELCLCNSVFWKEKLKRIRYLAQSGVRFIMFDEMDWRGQCFDPSHGHSIPSSPLEHVKAVYALAQEIKREFPDIILEVQDPVWPWNSCVYVPTYFKQGFGEGGCYHENWGYEFMWNCINDLQSGKALCLYYYNLSSNIPLYLHINMAADNDNALFFWWAASTIRHLGIGGKISNPLIEPPGKLPDYDKEARWNTYCRCMKIYKRLKAYYQRGVFTGLSPDAHLHTLGKEDGGVLDLFNRTQYTMTVSYTLTPAMIDTGIARIDGADWQRIGDEIHITATVAPMSHQLVAIGRAAEILEGVENEQI
jgi:hypothetical protein